MNKISNTEMVVMGFQATQRERQLFKILARKRGMCYSKLVRWHLLQDLLANPGLADEVRSELQWNELDMRDAISVMTGAFPNTSWTESIAKKENVR